MRLWAWMGWMMLGAHTAAHAAEPRQAVVRVLDASGSVLRGAEAVITQPGSGFVECCSTDSSGECMVAVPRGVQLQVRATTAGFAVQTVQLSAEASSVVIRLRPATLAQEVTISGGQVISSQEALRETAGSVEILDNTLLTQNRVFTVDEALRKAPGVFTRGEEGFGMRPNIGIRGLNPTRSSKVLLLEDGVPVSYAPYGDNASYYHPPVERFDQIEVVKGASQVAYGPMTIGGVINYLTPQAPAQRGGFLTLAGGSREYLNAHLQYGGTFKGTGLLFDGLRKQGDGARQNTAVRLNDFTAKVFRSLGSRNNLSLKVSHYDEISQLTYSGLREAEFNASPYGNPFKNDALRFRRWGASASHNLVIDANTVLTTTAYGSIFDRDWWRQSSNSAQRPNRSADAACGGMANLNTTCGNEGRLREYFTYGVEPRLRKAHTWLGAQNTLDMGFRAHYETQERLQENGAFPTARTGALVENNQRRNQAYAGFVQNRLTWGRLTLTPGLRLETVNYQRLNRLANGGRGVRGEFNLTQLIPGVGVSYNPTEQLTLFTGLHRGFAPPRTEDVVNNTTGGSVDLDPELSWNYEAGVRARVARHVSIEATYFRLDFQNQVIPASLAGGVGATLTNGGATLHEGAEISGRYDARSLLGSRHGLSLRAAWTYLPTAEFLGTRFSGISGFGSVSVRGNRLPYASRHLLNAIATYQHARGFNASMEGVYTAAQFSDDLNTRGGTPDGQRGLIPSNFVWNATANYPLEQWKTTLFVSVKNAADRLYIVDRSRGLLPGLPRMLQVGLRYTF